MGLMELVHGSRSAPLCKDCKHVERQPDRTTPLKCNHPSTPVSLLDGRSVIGAKLMRTAVPHALETLGFHTCGPDAGLFVRKQPGHMPQPHTMSAS